MIKQVIGILILAIFFVCTLCITPKVKSLKKAIIIFIGSLIIGRIVIFAIQLILGVI